jgi:sialate O-acetylesterase
VDARWVVCTPETVKEFSAVLYYFGRQLHQDLKVPIGLIHTSWGGTPIASWISGPALTAAPRLAPFLAFWEDQIASYPDRYTRYQQNLEKWEQNGSKGPRPSTPMGPGNPHQPTTLYNGMMAPFRTTTTYAVIAPPETFLIDRLSLSSSLALITSKPDRTSNAFNAKHVLSDRQTRAPFSVIG